MSGWMRRALPLLLLAALLLLPVSLRATVVPANEALLSAVPGAHRFEHILRPVDHYVLFDASGARIGVAFVTSSVPPQITAYRGEIDLLVGIDREGRVASVQLLDHEESPDYVDRIVASGLLDAFVGRSVKEDAQVEAITGATITSQAMIDDVASAHERVMAMLAGEEFEGPSPRTSIPWLPSVAVLLVLALALMRLRRPRDRILRVVTMIAAVGVVGVWFNSPITIGDLVDLRNGDLPSLAALPLLLLLLFALIATLVRGNLYCCFVCPFGALQEGAAAVGAPKCAPSDRALRALRWLRWIVAIAAIYAIAALGSSAFRTIEPFALLFSRWPGVTTIVQSAVILALALFVRRIWCRFFCPTGLVLDLIAMVGAKIRHALFRRRKGKDCEPNESP